MLNLASKENHLWWRPDWFPTVATNIDTGRSGATESGKNRFCLRIVPVNEKGKGQHSTILTNALLDPGLDDTLCDVSLMEKLQVDGCPKEFSLATVNGASDTLKGFKLCLPQGSQPTTANWPHLKAADCPRT